MIWKEKEKHLVLGIRKRIGLIGKEKLDAFIVRLQSVLQKNDQFGILSRPSPEHISRVAKCHGYDGYIRIKILAGWGKRTCNFAKSSLFLEDLYNVCNISKYKLA